MDFSWLGAEDELSAAALTVRAQQIPLDDNGTLLWPILAPRVDVDSLDFQSIDSIRFRPVGDRREWNTRGRMIPIRTPGSREFKWTPIETYNNYDEEQINELLRQVRGNQSLFRDLIRAGLPQRTDDLVNANSRRIEVDFFTGWLLGTVTQRNPQTGATNTVNLGIDSARYEVAATAWSDGSVNAYNLAMAFAERARDAMGGDFKGLGLRSAALRDIRADAPLLVTGGRALTRAEVEDTFSQELGVPFKFYTFEQKVDMFDDAGTNVTAQNVWPSQRVAGIPMSGNVADTLFAPVLRAYNIAAVQPKAGIDVRGMTVYHEPENGGRGLTVECQVNAFSNPIERKVYVANVGAPGA
jgi:hypothetical protein